MKIFSLGILLCEQVGHEVQLVLVLGRHVVNGEIVEEQVEVGTLVQLQDLEEVCH